VPIEAGAVNNQYAAVRGRDEPGRVSAVERLAALASAPLMGSRWIFPRRFDHAFELLVKDSRGAAVIPEHAIWFFGPTLHLEVDPLNLKERISDWVRDERGVRWTGSSFLDAVDWSAAIMPLANSPIHREMQELVSSPENIRDTRTYRTLLRAIALGRPSRRNNVLLDSAEAIEAYLNYCRDLIKSMRKRGVVRHSQSLAFHRLRLKHRDARSPVHDSTERDIGVAIAEDGELVRHLGGKHRTAIAMALKLSRLPVEIRMVHTGWLRRQVERTGLAPHLALADGIRLLVAGPPKFTVDGRGAAE
jgi:hypothetical protein